MNPDTHKVILDSCTWLEVNDDFKEVIAFCNVPVDHPKFSGTITTKIRIPFDAIKKILKIKLDN